MEVISSVLRTARWATTLAGGLAFGVFLVLDVVLKTFRHGFKALRGPTVGPDTPPPATLHDPKWGAHRFVTVNGVRLHYVEAGDPKKPLMLCVHGFPEFWYSWRFFLRAFSGTHHVVALDMRGYGESDKPSATWFGSRAYRVRELVRDIGEFIPAVGHASDRCAVLVTHDWGGVVGWIAAATLGESVVKRLVVLDAPHGLLYKKNMTLAQMARSAYFLYFNPPVLPEWYLSRGDYAAVRNVFFGRHMGVQKRDGPLAMTEGDLDCYRWSMSRPGALTAALNWYRQLPDMSYEDMGEGGSTPQRPLLMPVLVLWGEKDGALGLELLHGLDTVCRQVTVRVFEGASHWLQQEGGGVAEQVMNEVGAFLGAKPDIARCTSASA